MKVPAVGRREGDWRYAVPRRCAPRCAIPLVGVVPSARLRRAVPAGGRRSLACTRERVDTRSRRCAQRCRPEVGVPGPAAPLRPRGYVPRREPCRKWAGRRSPRCAGRCRSEDRRSRACHPVSVYSDTRSRCASGSGADRRSAFPGRRRHSSRGGTCRDGSHAGNGRYAVRGAARRGAGLKTGVPFLPRHHVGLKTGVPFLPRRGVGLKTGVPVPGPQDPHLDRG